MKCQNIINLTVLIKHKKNLRNRWLQIMQNRFQILIGNFHLMQNQIRLILFISRGLIHFSKNLFYFLKFIFQNQFFYTIRQFCNRNKLNFLTPILLKHINFYTFAFLFIKYGVLNFICYQLCSRLISVLYQYYSNIFKKHGTYQ